MPSRLDASVVKAVVLRGVGGWRVFFRAEISLTVPGVFELATAASASSFFQKRSVVCSATNSPSGWPKLGGDLPEGLRLVGAALELALHDQAERRALDAADGEEVGAEAPGGHRDGAGERGAPDQVDVLARGAGIGERHRELVEVVEGSLDLVLGERGVARALHTHEVAVLTVRERGVGRHDLLKRLEADQLALAVEVGRDHEVVGVLGHLLQRPDDVLVGRLLDQLGVDQVARIGLLPVVVRLGEGRVEHVTLEPDGHVLTGLVGPRVERRLVGRALGGAPTAQYLRDLLRAVVLLSDDQLHVGLLTVAMAEDAPW